MHNASILKGLFHRPAIITYKVWMEVDSLIVSQTLNGKRI